MITRRWTIASAATLAATGASCSQAPARYAQLARDIWREGPLDPAEATLELVRVATLAANSHNTQPWTFTLEPGRIRVSPDVQRRTPVVDPDDHHLFASLGCAVENMVQAAPSIGLAATPEFDAATGSIAVDLSKASTRDPALFAAIFRRRCSRSRYDGRPAPTEALKLLQASGGDAVDVRVITAPSELETVLENAVAANTAQMNAEPFREELKAWIRFDETEAARRRDGLFSRSSGNPSLPGWIGRRVFDLVVTTDAENDRLSDQLRSSSGVAVFTGASNNPVSCVEVGRACQRFALQATRLGLSHAFVNQPVEDVGTRGQFASWLGQPGKRPDLVIRFGYGPEFARSLRRPLSDVVRA